MSIPTNPTLDPLRPQQITVEIKMKPQTKNKFIYSSGPGLKTDSRTKDQRQQSNIAEKT